MTDEYDLDAGPDPAAVAAESPEPPTGAVADREPVFAVGVGPGDPEFLTARADRRLREADVVVGFETVVDYVRDRTDADALACGYADEGETLAAFAARVAGGEAGVAVLMGDPNFSGYQFLGKVERAVDTPVRVVPGISALQAAASRARTPMEATTFVTLHQSGGLDPDLARLRDDAGERHLLVLPRPYDWMPGDVAATAREAGASPTLTALVYERLTHDDETVTRTTVGDLADDAGGSGPDETAFSDMSVLVIRADEPRGSAEQ
jgi:cobalt-precorrin-7 (C5)-methyltransferase